MKSVIRRGVWWLCYNAEPLDFFRVPATIRIVIVNVIKIWLFMKGNCYEATCIYIWIDDF